MAYQIFFWHGMTSEPKYRSKKDRALIDKLKNMSHMVVAGPNNEYEWHGTLDQFFEQYQDMFIVRCGSPVRDQTIPLICVTQHGHFGQM